MLEIDEQYEPIASGREIGWAWVVVGAMLAFLWLAGAIV
jgi:hypothetical protein